MQSNEKNIQKIQQQHIKETFMFSILPCLELYYLLYNK
jgi:hypothetical protein